MNATIPDIKELEAIGQELRVTIEDQLVESGQYDEIMASCGLTAEYIVAAAKTAVVRKILRERDRRTEP